MLYLQEQRSENEFVAVMGAAIYRECRNAKK